MTPGALRRRTPAVTLVLALVVAIGMPAVARARTPYTRLAPVLSTPWTALVSPSLPLPDYPRPQLVRARWLNLNGQWEYATGAAGEAPPLGQALGETILVPFPVQSALSGIGRPDTYGWYRRFFVVPGAWRGDRVLLNFGAVAWRATVYVNGHELAIHQGSYDGFTVDVTRALRHGANELVVGYWNPMGAHGEPVGKQIPGLPYSFYHSASSGIWQTVWLEPVPATRVRAIEVSAAAASGGRASVSVAVSGPASGMTVTVRADALGHTVGTASGPAGRGGRGGRTLTLSVARPRRWSPAAPFLYGLTVELRRGRTVIDRVRSYFGLRTVALARIRGVTRIVLDGHPLFGSGALDQAMWPDGLMTAPSDDALRADVATAAHLGFNLLRVHQTVEPDRFYMWADRLGMLVWQDMPSSALRSPLARLAAAQHEFRHELAQVVLARSAHPSIVAWIPFNEGWNAFDPAGIVSEIRALDPTRLIDTDSGSANTGDTPEVPAGDLRDTHLYPGPFAVLPDHRASIVGEFGGVLPLPGPADRWPGVLTSVGSPVAGWSHSDIESVLRAQYAALREEELHGGVSAAMFTELFAIEQETGLVTYDRRATLLPARLILDLNREVIDAAAPGGGPPKPRSGPRGTGGGGIPAPAVPTGTGHLWRFDDRSGTSAADAAGAARGIPLALGAGTNFSGGVRGGSLALAGGTATAPTPVVDTARSFTVAAWLSPGAARETGYAVSEPGGGASAFALGVQTVTPSGRPPRTWWTFGVGRVGGCAGTPCGATANMHYGDGRYSPGVGRWHYVAGVYDAAGRTITVYVDGLAQDIEHTNSLTPPTGPLEVGTGTLGTAPAAPFVGRVDALRLYPRALEPAEMWALFAASRTGDPVS